MDKPSSLRLTTPAECSPDMFICNGTATSTSPISRSFMASAQFPRQLELLQEQRERLQRLRGNIVRLCVQLSRGDKLLEKEEIELDKLHELQQDEELKSCVAESETVMVAAECSRRRSLRARLAHQLNWLCCRNHWLDKIEQWLAALLDAMMMDKDEWTDERLQQLNEWFMELRAEAIKECPTVSFDTTDEFMVPETTRQNEHRRIADPPYVLQWLSRAISQVEEGTASLSTSNCSSVTDEEPPDDIATRFLLHFLSERMSHSSAGTSYAHLINDHGAFENLDSTDVESILSTDTLT